MNGALASKLKSSNNERQSLRRLNPTTMPRERGGPLFSRVLGRCVVRINPEATRSLCTAETPAAPQLNKGRPLPALIVAYTSAAPRSPRTLELIEDYLTILALPWRLDETRFAFETKCKSF